MARIKHGTLAANTVTPVDISQRSGTAEVMITGSPAAIYFRVDGVDPTIKGDDCEVVPAGTGAALVVDLPEPFSIKLISAGTPDYCVKGV